MVRAWYMDDSKEDQRAEHHRTPPAFIDVKDLYKITGVEYFTINPQTYSEDGELESIKRKRGYTYEDQIVCSRECLPNYEEKGFPTRVGIDPLVVNEILKEISDEQGVNWDSVAEYEAPIDRCSQDYTDYKKILNEL